MALIDRREETRVARNLATLQPRTSSSASPSILPARQLHHYRAELGGLLSRYIMFRMCTFASEAVLSCARHKHLAVVDLA